MTGSLFTGPLISAGNMLDSSGSPQKTNSDSGPSILYRGAGFPDVRYNPINKELLGNPGIIPSFATTQLQRAVNAVPSTLGSSGNIAAPAHVTNGTPMTQAGASAGINTGIPFSPVGSGVIIQSIQCLDMGFDLVSVTSGSVNVTVTDSTLYKVGQPICIGNVGSSSGGVALLTFVTGITSATVITINDKALATNSSASVDTALPGWNNLIGLGPIEPTFCAPYLEGGAGLFYDSRRIFARGIAITGVSGGAGGAFTISGYDGWGQLQTETITVAAGANTVGSVKTYKYITSITPTFTDAHNYSVNTADLFGFPLFNKYWEELMIFYNGALITSNTGWTAGDTTSPATKTTKDVRGTYALQTASNSSDRLVIYQLPSFAEMGASPTNYTSLYGVTPV